MSRLWGLIGLVAACTVDPGRSGQHETTAAEAHHTGRAEMKASGPRVPAVAPSRPVTEIYHGKTVVDPYRWMETGAPEVSRWLANQDAYAREVLRRIPGRQRLLDELRRLNRAEERIDILAVIGSGPRIFLLRRGATDENWKLVVRDGWHGIEKVLFDPTKVNHEDGTLAIDFAVPSPDGEYVAYGTSASGSEDSLISVVEVESGQILRDKIDRAQQAAVSWRPDSRSFFFHRRSKAKGDAPASEWHKGGATYLHVLGEEQGTVPVFSAAARSSEDSYELTSVEVTPGSRWAIAAMTFGVSGYTIYTAALAKVAPGRNRWRRVVGPDDKVLGVLAHKDRLYAFSFLGADNYRVVSFDARSGSFAQGIDFVPASEFVLKDFVGAKDAMYVVAMQNGTDVLWRVDWRTGRRNEIALPFPGTIRKLIGSPAREGVVFSMEGWTRSPSWFRADAKVTALRPSPTGLVGMLSRQIESKEVLVAGPDAVQVPLSIVHRADAKWDGSAPTLLSGYGAYGTVLSPSYNPFALGWVLNGGVYAVCHVRGGGEKGKHWHLAGIKEKKENGVDDYLACAQYLIGNGYTNASRLTATCASAGGIVVGGAITKRPDLFAAAILRVPVVNLFRNEATRVGPANVTEYGSVSDAAGFEYILKSDPYYRIRSDVKYPSVILTAGMHDVRVPAWQPGKFAARLQSVSGAGNVLLRVEREGGHGGGTPQGRLEAEYADMYSFALWKSGVLRPDGSSEAR